MVEFCQLNAKRKQELQLLDEQIAGQNRLMMEENPQLNFADGPAEAEAKTA